jgi:MPBQ/MSBQ methyltransferase
VLFASSGGRNTSLEMDIAKRPVQQHYARPALFERIVTALEQAGKNLDHISTEDLAPVDEFHTRVRPATVELAKLLGLIGMERVLDLGCGIGGPSRFLARTYGCHVIGIDLTLEFVEVAAKLARLTRLDDRVSYR